MDEYKTSAAGEVPAQQAPPQGQYQHPPQGQYQQPPQGQYQQQPPQGQYQQPPQGQQYQQQPQYAQQPMQGAPQTQYVQPPPQQGQAVVTQYTPKLGMMPVTCKCMACDQQQTTNVDKTCGWMGWSLCLGVTCLGCVVCGPCVFCFDEAYDHVHYCSKCGAQQGPPYIPLMGGQVHMYKGGTKGVYKK